MINKYKISLAERKMLVHNKMKSGLTYREAYEQVAKDIEQCNKIKVKEKTKEKVDVKDFKNKFKELIDG